MLPNFDDVQDVGDDEIEFNMKWKEKVGDEDLSSRGLVYGNDESRLTHASPVQDVSTNPRWQSKSMVSESKTIPNVPELIQISSFMSSHKCLELSKRFSDNIPKTVDEMLKRVVIIYVRKKRSVTQNCPRVNSNKKKYRWGNGGSGINDTNGCLITRYQKLTTRSSHSWAFHSSAPLMYIRATTRCRWQEKRRKLPSTRTKDITKANKHDYRWTEKAKNAFQELKKMILDLPVLTTLILKETIRIHCGIEGSGQCSTSGGKERKAMSSTLSHPITVITDQPIKQILNKADTSDTHKSMQHASESKVGGCKGHSTRILLANDASGRKRRNMQVRFMPKPLSNPQASQNVDDFNHGTLSILLVGMDVLGPLPEAPRKVKFVIMAVDYFTKWIEAKPLARTTGKEVKKFINTTVEHPQANGLVERANRSLMERIKTRLGRERKGWVDKLPNVVWAHRTLLKTSNGETPYNLMFRSEVVIPAEIGTPTHRTMMIKEGEGNEEEIRLNLDLLMERREATTIREARY
uniref:Reverse transcriptase domain-containing protein n=1 Tax=Tanacetum cinerariifolium TaxID=118510 RepID=A0A699I4C6_TANCI|nr:reverse transcriptase domain-containing protein [Tanacetum cinerariifolium]